MPPTAQVSALPMLSPTLPSSAFTSWDPAPHRGTIKLVKEGVWCLCQPGIGKVLWRHETQFPPFKAVTTKPTADEQGLNPRRELLGRCLKGVLQRQNVLYLKELPWQQGMPCDGTWCQTSTAHRLAEASKGSCTPDHLVERERGLTGNQTQLPELGP